MLLMVIRCAQTNLARIYPDKTTALYIQDNKTYHGNNLRARTLFNEDETLEKVTAVYWNCEAGEIHVYEDMGFNKINKDRIGRLCRCRKG